MYIISFVIHIFLYRIQVQHFFLILLIILFCSCFLLQFYSWGNPQLKKQFSAFINRKLIGVFYPVFVYFYCFEIVSLIYFFPFTICFSRELQDFLNKISINFVF